MRAPILLAAIPLIAAASVAATAMAQPMPIDQLSTEKQLQIRQLCMLYAQEQRAEAAYVDRSAAFIGANAGCISAEASKALKQRGKR